MPKAILIIFLFIICASSLLNAQSNSSILTKAVRTELDRSFNELKKEPKAPYFISYQVIEKYSNTIQTSFGKLVSHIDAHTRFLDIDLRVGDYKLDNSHIIRGNYDAGGNIYSSATLPLTDNELAIRNSIWSATDIAFRKAIEKYEKALTNQTVKVAAEDTSADFSKEKPSKYFEDFRVREYYNEKSKISTNPKFVFAVDTVKWINLCKRLSEKFVAHKWLLDGGVSFTAELTNKYFINTEGSEVQYPETAVRIMIDAKTKADDGMILPLYKSYFAFEAENLPSETTIEKDIDELIATLEKLRNAPVATTFTGPAILTGEVSGVFFHEIFGHRVEGFREKDPDASNTFKQSIGKKVLPDFIDVVFDPTQKQRDQQDLAGYYKYDDECIKSEKVVSVKNGIFQKFLMSRSPIEGFENSNGHGRKSQGKSVVTRQSNLMVIINQPKPKEELRKMLIEEAKKQDKEYGLMFTKVSGGFTMITRFIPNSFNVLPLVVYKIYVDGRPDELVRGVDLIGTPLTTFSNIIAGADDVGIFNGICGAESGWVPVSASSPSLLVSKIEVQKKSKSQAKLPILPFPKDENSTK